MIALPARLALIALLACVVVPAAEPGALYGTATLAYPAGTKAVASFRTQDGNGADKLIDGDEQTVMMGAEGTVTDPTAPVWVDITFGKPVENLLGVVTGDSDKFANYYPKTADVLVDTTGNGTFDIVAVKGVKLGPAHQAAGQHRFAKPVAKAFALRFLVTEQNKAGVGRAFSLSSLALLASPPTAQPPAPVARPVRVAEAGDRHIRMDIVYPKGAFKENGGPVLNLRNPPFNAVGDGRTDDTAAFIRVLDFIANEQRDKRRNWIVYLPKGTYLVSDALVSQADAGPEGFCSFRLIGQDRDETVIRLKDNAPGFGDAGKPRTVLPWEGRKPGQGNILWGNQARNFTIDTGTGNPGAIAMTFMGANASSMDNITLRSGDGQGAIGLHFSWWSVQGHCCDITIEGFDVGIRGTDSREAQPTLEYVTLTGQRKAGYEVGPHAASIRRLLYRGPAPAVVVNHPYAQTVLVDSRLEGKDATAAAIVMRGDTGAQVFARNVAVSGYAVSLDAFGVARLTGDIVEYVSGQLVRTRNDAPTQSMDLPVEEVSLVPWESDPDKWASPEDYQGSAVERIQAALDSGKPAIYFPREYGKLQDGVRPFRIPATIRQMDFMGFNTFWPSFQVAEATATPLWVEHASRAVWITLDAPRNIHFRMGRFCALVNTDEPFGIHMQNGAGLSASQDPKACPKNVRIYARSINEESHYDKGVRPNFRVNGGLMWVLGFKTEQRQASFLVENGGLLEVLGGYVNMTAGNQPIWPMIINNDSHASVIGTSYMGRKHPDAIWEKRGDWSITVTNDELPRRVGSQVNYTIPLYLGYDPAAVARALAATGAGR